MFPINTATMTADQFATLYRDYINNFLTVSCFAQHYEVNEHTAYYIIQRGYHAHEVGVLKIRLLSTLDSLLNAQSCGDAGKNTMIDDSILKISTLINSL